MLGSSARRRIAPASKLDRDPGFIRDLMSHGAVRAEEFLAALAFEDAWRSRGTPQTTDQRTGEKASPRRHSREGR